MSVNPRAWFVLCFTLAGLALATPAGAADAAAPPQDAASVAATVAVQQPDPDDGDLPHRAAMVLAAVAAIGFVTRRLRD